MRPQTAYKVKVDHKVHTNGPLDCIAMKLQKARTCGVGLNGQSLEDCWHTGTCKELVGTSLPLNEYKEGAFLHSAGDSVCTGKVFAAQ